MPRKPAILLHLLSSVLGSLSGSGQHAVPSPHSTALLQHPLPTDRDGRHIYWREQNQGWRSELEVDAERQAYLASHRAIKPDMKQSIYPFKDVKLSRADVEWLLATHHGGRGPLFFEAPPEGPHMRGDPAPDLTLLANPLIEMIEAVLYNEDTLKRSEARKFTSSVGFG